MNPSLARIIDANANRAREALRTMEDVARFRLADGSLSGRIKEARHGLRAALDGLRGGALVLYAARDVGGDVGTNLKVAAEGERGNLRGVAIAAGKRAAEALRVLEEMVKIVEPEGRAWRAVEGLRYRVYTLDRELVLAMGTGRAPQWRLCVLVTESLCRRPWREVVAAAVRGGADCVQVREPGMSDGALLERVRGVMGVVREDVHLDGQPEGWIVLEDSQPTPLPPPSGRGGRNASVIVNDRVDVALAAGADGVHLGMGDLPIVEARRICGDELLIGASTHSLDEARSAAAAGTDYCGVGAMFVSSTKDRAVSGPGYLRDYLGAPTLAEIPHLAIGGITIENIGVLAAAGCRGIAVSSAVCGAEDPEGVCRALLGAMVRGEGQDHGPAARAAP